MLSLDQVFENTMGAIDTFDAEQRLIAIGMRRGARELYDRLKEQENGVSASSVPVAAQDAEQEAADIQE